MKRLVTGVLATAALSMSTICTATPIVVNYQVINYGGALPGYFSGNDTNNDGVISLSELVSFYFRNTAHNHYVSLANLAGFGDFNYLTNSWTPNGFGWGNYGSYFSWNGGSSSVHGSWAQLSSSVERVKSVPEPTSLLLIGLGLAAMATSRRGRSQGK